jgi:phosphatidylglycerol lysyltransferase
LPAGGLLSALAPALPRVESLTPTANRSPSPGQRAFDEPLYALLRRYGSHTVAYSTSQPGLSYFRRPEGFIAYGTKWGTRYVLGDPVAAPESREALIAEFLKDGRATCFAMISRPTAEILVRHGYHANEIGIDIRIDLRTYDFTGPAKARFRQGASKLDREDYRVLELSDEQIDPARIERVSDVWKQSRPVSSREVRFLNRPISTRDEIDVRKFYVFSPAGDLVAFYFFDPIYRDGRVIGYSTSFKRRTPDAPTRTEEAVSKHAFELFKAEGKEVVTLGLIPLYGVKDEDLPHSRATSWIMRRLYASKNFTWVYNFQGHAEFKTRYQGEPVPMYFASRGRLDLIRLLGLLKLCDVFSARDVARAMFGLGRSLARRGAHRLSAAVRRPAENTEAAAPSPEGTAAPHQ